MNKYERARILAERAKQLENGAEPTTDITGLDDALRIAQKELREGVIPLKIRRRKIDGDLEFKDELSGDELSGEEESFRVSRTYDGNQGEHGDGSGDEDVVGEVHSEDGSENEFGNGTDASEDE